MIRRAIPRGRGLLALLAVFPGGSVAPAAAEDVLAAIAASADDVKQTILVGPSGQVFEPDGAGTWTRRTEGGVAADVRGAVVAGTGLVVAGKSAPLYRRDGDRWTAMRLGERGRTAIGTGPRAALAIGKLVFVWSGSTWKRVGRAPGTVTALWAASETKVFAATDGGLLRLAGGAFSPLGAGTPAVVGFGGVTAWAVTADGAAFEVATRRIHRPTVGGQAIVVGLVTATTDSAWALGTTDAGPALARFHKGAWTEAVAPPIASGDAPISITADRSGALLVVTRAGGVHVAGPDGRWDAGTRVDALPAVPAGPGPARGR